MRMNVMGDTIDISQRILEKCTNFTNIWIMKWTVFMKTKIITWIVFTNIVINMITPVLSVAQGETKCNRIF